MPDLVGHLRFNQLHSSSLLPCCWGLDVIEVVKLNIQMTALFPICIAVFCYLGHLPFFLKVSNKPSFLVWIFLRSFSTFCFWHLGRRGRFEIPTIRAIFIGHNSILQMMSHLKDLLKDHHLLAVVLLLRWEGMLFSWCMRFWRSPWYLI